MLLNSCILAFAVLDPVDFGPAFSRTPPENRNVAGGELAPRKTCRDVVLRVAVEHCSDKSCDVDEGWTVSVG